MDINDIKRRVYAMRNGVAADVLRRGGAPYRMIFGVNIPHLAEIAAEIGKSVGTADILWADSGVRESLILATMVHPPELMTPEKARTWLGQAPSAEIVDMLCHRIIGRMPYAAELAAYMARHSDNDLSRYAALRIYFNLLPDHRVEARRVAEHERQRHSAVTAIIAASLLDELDFIEDTQEA